MSVNRLDNIYRSVVLTRYFVKGWGKSENLKKLFEWRKLVSSRESCYQLVSPDYPVHIGKEVEGSDYYLINGHFVSPLTRYLPDIIPEESKTAYFQLILPKKWKSEDFKPVCVHIAGTGDQYFWRRRTFSAKPLIKEGCIGSVLLENPFYGQRKPRNQVRSILNNVSDLFVMGGCLLLESLVLFHYCERLGLGPLGITGVSMGGHNASIAATNWPKPLVIVPCLSGLSAAEVFTQGVMSGAIDWKLLEKQFQSDSCYKDEIMKMICNTNNDAFRAGQQFAKNLSNSQWLEHSLNNPIKPSGMAAPELNEKDIPKKKLLHEDVVQDIPEMKDENVFDNEDRKSKSVPGTSLFDKIASDNPLNLSDLNIPSVQSSSGNPTADIMEANKREAISFMQGIMDECTHLKNYSVPLDTSLVIAVLAIEDGYVPFSETENIKSIWCGSEVRYIKCGHVVAYLRHQKSFRKAVIDAFAKYQKKYGSPLKSANISRLRK